MFLCFDDAKGSSASKFYSRQESNNPRKSRYMIKLISRILGRGFQIEKIKRFGQRILSKSFQIAIYSLVIDHQQLKMFITVTRNLNSKFIM